MIYKLGEQITIIIVEMMTKMFFSILLIVKLSMRSIKKSLAVLHYNICLMSQKRKFSLPRKSMVLRYNEARIKRENQLIDVLNNELDVRDINPQNLSDFHNT